MTRRYFERDCRKAEKRAQETINREQRRLEKLGAKIKAAKDKHAEQRP